MRLARVIGTVVSTIKHPAYVGQRIMLCQPLEPNGGAMGAQMIALDRVDSGVGDLVLILTEGNGVRQIMQSGQPPIRSLIVGIVDAVDLHEGSTGDRV
ncbi:MAG: EutN/CcmL family microcompartment protein [Myxococcota bacterium]|nr:EutN/CcmL family microcompartment protein [Myxococcota bacterium]